MIKGIGTDLVEIDRIEHAMKNERFLEKCYTDNERQIVEGNAQRAAGNFAVKEAFTKALGTGIRGFSIKEIEVLRDELGKPYITLYGKVKKMTEEMGSCTLHVSISNTKEYAQAFVIIERD